MKKKLLMVLLCGAMVCSLAACGSKDDVTENTESTEDVELVTGRLRIRSKHWIRRCMLQHLQIIPRFRCH